MYLDGSFVSKKRNPNDFDACWDDKGVNGKILDPVFSDPSTQKLIFYGEFYPAIVPGTTLSFLNFFKNDRAGNDKGIILVDLTSDPLL